MYKCIFIKYLWKDADTKRLYRTLEKILTVPFPPSVGYEIGEGEWFSGKLERIVWDNKAETFTIKTTDITPKTGISAELLLEIAEKQGWVVQAQK